LIKLSANSGALYSYNINNNYELKLYEQVLPSIFGKHCLVFADYKIYNKLKKSKILNLTSKCQDANLLVGYRFDDIDTKCLNKPIFSTTARSYKNQKNSFGAFYWMKGRPQIRFDKCVLDKFDLKLPDNLKEFAR
jgi:hypothetical protein